MNGRHWPSPGWYRPIADTFILSFSPTGFYVFLEYIINISLVLEVAVRIAAQRKTYFTFLANIVDVLIVIFCVVTLVFLHRECTVGNEFEKALDSILLVFRYVELLVFDCEGDFKKLCTIFPALYDGEEEPTEFTSASKLR